MLSNRSKLSLTKNRSFHSQNRSDIVKLNSDRLLITFSGSIVHLSQSPGVVIPAKANLREEKAATPVAWQDDTRLQRLFSITSPCVTVGQVVEQIEKQCDLSLHIEGVPRHQKLRIHVKKCAASAILPALAELIQS